MTWPKTKIILAALAVLVLAAAMTLFLRWLLNPQRVALAKGERLVAKNLAAPVDMTDNYQTPASSFSRIKQFPAWASVPIGFQTFDGVPVDIEGMICLWGGGNAKGGLVFPEQLEGIKIGGKFETLYVYHSSFYASPHGTPVYDIVFRYDDGTSATNQILYGNDISDWYARRGKFSKPTDPRSAIAWTGIADTGKSKIPLQFFLTAVENPQPDTTVATIDLYSCKSQTAACIHAMTTGQTGLMQKK
ncbi:MAG TPA: hypothetical protein VGI03_03850 [Verrucomicrobiae bacterium]|jgi:hypothetical protein